METRISDVWIDDKAVYIRTDEGNVFSEYFENYPRLRSATPKQRANFEYNNLGIHWEDLNEDFSFYGFMNKSAH